MERVRQYHLPKVTFPLAIQRQGNWSNPIPVSPSGSIGVRAAECEDFVTRHKVKAFICLDDDATLFPPEYPHLFRTDYYTGVNEKDLTDLIARYNVLMTRFY